MGSGHVFADSHLVTSAGGFSPAVTASQGPSLRDPLFAGSGIRHFPDSLGLGTAARVSAPALGDESSWNYPNLSVPFILSAGSR